MSVHSSKKQGQAAKRPSRSRRTDLGAPIARAIKETIAINAENPEQVVGGAEAEVAEALNERKVERVLREVESLIGDRFPKGKLRNRLLNLGLEEFIEGIVSAGDGEAAPTAQLAVHRWGFPFRFLAQLDEAILVLAHYLNRFKREGGSLKIHGLNLLSKGEHKTLSYWQSEKARLYIEVQNLILLLNGLSERESSITRVFVFEDIDDLAFLAQPAISVINEQLASNIKIGLLFLNQFKKDDDIDAISNTLIVEYLPQAPTPDRHNFYALHSLPNNSTMHDLPYQDRCMAKWFKNRAEATASLAYLEPMLDGVFDTSRWSTKIGSYKHDVTIPGLVRYRNKDENFKDAEVMMYQAYVASALEEQGYPPKAMVGRMCETVITSDMIRLERAISAFSNSKTIKAVDPTSVKNSIKLHGSEPTYRRWMRTSLNGILRKGSEQRLERIYILDDEKTKASAESEFQAFRRIMQYYFDYCHYDIAEMSEVVHRHLKDENGGRPGGDREEPPPWLVEAWTSLRKRLNIYVTTRNVLEQYAPQVMDAIASRAPGNDSGIYMQMLEEITSADYVRPQDAYESLARLDFLFTEDMVYNFTTQRADPGELSFESYLYRGSFNVEKEERVLLKFTDRLKLAGSGDVPSRLAELRTPHRLEDLADSVIKYRDAHESLLDAEQKRHADTLAYIEEQRQKGGAFVDADASRFLEVRRDFEHRLFRHFKPMCEHLFDVLKFHSVEVEFFKNMGQALVETVYPFSACEDVGKLTALIGQKVSQNLESAARDPERLPKPPVFESRVGAGGAPTRLEAPATPTRAHIFLSYAREDLERVTDAYRRLKDLGHEPWIDHIDILPGQKWEPAIEVAMEEEADFVIVFLSLNSFDKRSFLQREIRKALALADEMLDEDSYLIPALLEECDIPRRLRAYQIVKLFAPDGWTQLEKAINDGIERRKAKASKSRKG